MQFYIIHKDPETNVDLLPIYAIKNVNVREGYQILSDIGHLFDVTWEGQNKPYSIWHAETRRFWRNVVSFENFLSHYKACLDKYNNLVNRQSSWTDKFNHFIASEAPNKIKEALLENHISDEEDQMMFKLLNQKDKYLNLAEKVRIVVHTLDKIKGDYLC